MRATIRGPVHRAMEKEHRAFYSQGAAVTHNLFYGSPITEFDYAELIRPFGGFGRRVDDPTELLPAVREAIAAVRSGETAILNVITDSAAGSSSRPG